MSGLSLVLDTDEAYVHQTKADTGSRVKNLPTPDDRLLLERLVSYKTLELILKATLVARVGWKPDGIEVHAGDKRVFALWLANGEEDGMWTYVLYLWETLC